MKRKYEIKGLRIEKFIQNINNKEYIENERYIFNCKSDERKYEIVLYFNFLNKMQKKAELMITPIDRFVGTSYRPKRFFSIIIDSECNEQHNEAFDFNSLDIIIKYENFIKTARMKNFRPVWIFRGESNLGKSYLTNILSNNSSLTIYETDSNPKLPAVLFQDIINVGNKYQFKIDEIEKRIYGFHESIIVDFSK